MIKAEEMQVGKTYRVVKLPNGDRTENGGVWTVKYKNENGVPFGVKPEWPVDHPGTRLSTSHVWEEVVTGTNFDEEKSPPTPEEIAASLPYTGTAFTEIPYVAEDGRMLITKIANKIRTYDLQPHCCYVSADDNRNEVCVLAVAAPTGVGIRATVIGQNESGSFVLNPDDEWYFVRDTRLDFPTLSPTPNMSRDDILREAAQAVTVDRAATHGNMEDNFSNIAQIWSVRLGKTVTAEQVAIMMVDLKTVRAWGNPGHMDNWVDMAGYAACGGEISDGIKD